MTDLPREQQRALADLCGFDLLDKFDSGYAANSLHTPELSHSPAVIDALVRHGFAARIPAPAAGVVPTSAGRKKNNEIRNERLGVE